jgi:hypothetical protein
MKPARFLAAAAVLLGLAACVPEASPLMRPGQDCLSCHTGDRKPWTIAGTLYDSYTADENAGLEGGEVLVKDANGRELTMRTNPAGNFFTAEKLAFPVQVQVQHNGLRMAMGRPIETGACNSCHAGVPLNGAPGRLAVPAAALAK